MRTRTPCRMDFVPPPPTFADRVKRARVMEALLGLMSEACRDADRGRGHRHMDMVLGRAVMILGRRCQDSADAGIANDLVRRFEKADRRFE